MKKQIKRYAIAHLKFLARLSSKTGVIHSQLIFLLTFLKRGSAYAERQFRLAKSGGDIGAISLGKMKERYLAHLAMVMKLVPVCPKISILLPVYKVEPRFLESCLESMGAQVYENWELCIVDDRSGDPRLIQLIERFAAKHPGKVKWNINEKNSHISITSNACFELSTGDYIGLLDHDDELAPQALAEMVRHINFHESPPILYSDEIVINPEGEPLGGAFYKPAWSPVMMRSYNVVTHFLVMKRDLLKAIGGFRTGVEGAQDHDLVLRASEVADRPPVHVPFVLYRWRSHPASSASGIDAKPYAAISGEKVVSDHLKRLGIAHESVQFDAQTGHQRVKYVLSGPPPKVSILIPTRDGGAVFDRCVDSLLGRTRYANFEVVVIDNGSTKPEFLRRLKGLPDVDKRVSVVRSDEPFNFARLNHLGAQASSGEFLLLLNDDTEVVAETWLENMVAMGVQKGIGVVGPKLLYPDGLIQHAGIVAFPVFVGGHLGAREASNTSMYNHVVNTTREVAAVTGACLLIRRSLFDSLQGLDQLYLPNSFGDVDLCFKVRQKGLSCVYCADATLIHYESISRGLNFDNFERAIMHRKWPAEILTDPYLNPNLKRELYFEPEQRFPELH